MLPLAIGNAGSVLVGQAIGAREPPRARATGIAAIAVSLGCGLAVGAAIFLAAGPIVRLYTADPDVQRLAVGLLVFVAVYHVFDAVQAAAVQILRGYKRAAVPMVIYGVALWGIALGGGYALGIGGVGVGAPMRATGFWLAAVVGMALTAALVSVYFLRVSRASSS
jgi:MATE family multidrug resistance protein